MAKALGAVFLFNVELAQTLKDLSAEQAGALLQAGSKWAGSGWSTARAFKQLQATVGVPLVQSSISTYRDSWLFALSLFWDVEVGLLDLPDRGAEAAFALCARLSEGRGGVPSQEPVTREGREAEEEEDEEAAARFDWDEPLYELPSDLQALWEGVRSHARKLDLRSVLEAVPKYNVIPLKAPENNHRGDGKRERDRQVKAWSQTLLHNIRIQSHIYDLMLSCGDPLLVKKLFQQQWQLSAELYWRMCEHRKESSIPGSVVVPQDVLFDKDDLSLAQQQAKINSTYFGKGNSKSLFSSKIITIPSGKGKSFQGSYSGSYGKFQPNRYRGQGVPICGQGVQFQIYTGGYGSSYFRGGFGGQGGFRQSYRGRGKSGMCATQGTWNFLSSSLQVEREVELVEEACLPTSGEDDSRRGDCTLESRQRAMADNDCKGATACGRGTAAFGGLLGHWSRQGVEQTSRHAFAGFSFHARHSSFGSMVSHQKGRRYFSESQADYRLSSGQQVFALPSFQNGSLGPNFSFPAGRDVGLQDGSERCLLSPALAPS